MKASITLVLYHFCYEQRVRIGRKIEVKYLYFLAFHLFKKSVYICTCAQAEIQNWMSSTENSYHTLTVPHTVRLYTMIWCMKWQTEAIRGDWELAAATLSKHWQECLVCKPHIKPGSLCALNLTCMRKRIATLTEVTGEILHASLLLFWTPAVLTQGILLWACQFIHIHTAYWVRQQIGYLIACLLLLLHFVKCISSVKCNSIFTFLLHQSL